MVELSNSLVTAQALLEDTCAAILVEAEFAGTVELEDWANSATAVGRYVSEVQKLGESDLFTPMTTSTLPEVSAPELGFRATLSPVATVCRSYKRRVRLTSRIRRARLRGRAAGLTWILSTASAMD